MIWFTRLEKIIWKDWTETVFLDLYPVTGPSDGEKQDDGSEDGEFKVVLEFVDTVHNNMTS